VAVAADAKLSVPSTLAVHFFPHYLTSMMFGLGLILIAMPILDIASLIKAGDLWGFWPTLGLVLAAGLLGTTIVRHRGLSIGRQVQQSLNAGRLPVIEAFDAACVLAAGALLLLPGLASDVVALLLLLPPVRALLRRTIAWRLRRNGEIMVWRHEAPGDVSGRSSAASNVGGPVIEGEFQPAEPRAGAADDGLQLPPRLGRRWPARDGS
jgi:UPF0716 protein FxsA